MTESFIINVRWSHTRHTFITGISINRKMFFFLYWIWTQVILSCGFWGYSSFNSLRPSDVHICVSKLTIIGSDNGLSPGQLQAIIWTSDEKIMLTDALGINLNEIWSKIQAFSFKNMHLKIHSEQFNVHSSIYITRGFHWNAKVANKAQIY